MLASKSSQNAAPAGQPAPPPLLDPPSLPPHPLPPSPAAIIVPLLDPLPLLELPAALLLLPPLDELLEPLLDPLSMPLLLPPELLDELLDPRSLPLLDELLLEPPELPPCPAVPEPGSEPASRVGDAAVLLHAGRTMHATPSEIVSP